MQPRGCTQGRPRANCLAASAQGSRAARTARCGVQDDRLGANHGPWEPGQAKGRPAAAHAGHHAHAQHRASTARAGLHRGVHGQGVGVGAAEAGAGGKGVGGAADGDRAAASSTTSTPAVPPSSGWEDSCPVSSLPLAVRQARHHSSKLTGRGPWAGRSMPSTQLPLTRSNVRSKSSARPGAPLQKGRAAARGWHRQSWAA